jgi:hypothetical protein
LIFRTEVHRVHVPEKTANGRVSSKANHTGGREPSGKTSFSEKLVKGTTQRFSTPVSRFQIAHSFDLWIGLPAFRAKARDGMPHRAIVSSRPAS